MTPPDLSALAASLTEAQRRAVLAIGSEWTFTGKKTVHPSAAQSLRLFCPDLVEHDWIKPTARSQRAKGAYRLTLLGEQVRAHLTKEKNDADQ